MSDLESLIGLLEQGELDKILPVLTVIGGGFIAVMQYLLKAVYAQHTNEIEKAFMVKKQRTGLKLMEASNVALVLFLLHVTLMLVLDETFNGLFALSSLVSIFLICIYFIYRLLYFIWCKYKRINRKWKFDDAMKQMLFVCETLIGLEFCKLVYIKSNIWYGLLMCILAAAGLAMLLIISTEYMRERPSKISYKNLQGKRKYIYYKLEENLLLCGDKPDMKDARLILISYDDFKKANYELMIE